ncbi:hypothetical protein D3C78_1240990 [compost metagenome]
MDLTPGFRHARIPRHHFDAALHGFFEHRNQGIRIIGGNGDRIDTLCDQPVQHFDLRFGGGRCRTGVNHFDIT